MKGRVFHRITHLDLKLVPVKFYFKKDETLFDVNAERSDLT